MVAKEIKYTYHSWDKNSKTYPLKRRLEYLSKIGDVRREEFQDCFPRNEQRVLELVGLIEKHDYCNVNNLPSKEKKEHFTKWKVYYDSLKALKQEISEITSILNDREANERKNLSYQFIWNGFLKEQSPFQAGRINKELSKNVTVNNVQYVMGTFIETALKHKKLSASVDLVYPHNWRSMTETEQKRYLNKNELKRVYTVCGHKLGKIAYDYAIYLVAAEYQRTKKQ